jgi:hypothetical protein
MAHCQKAIKEELDKVIERLGGDHDLLALIAPRGDTMTDDDVLAVLRDWNASRPIFHSIINRRRE